MGKTIASIHDISSNVLYDRPTVYMYTFKPCFTVPTMLSQLTNTKDYILHAASTPPAEEAEGASLQNISEKWIAKHASQVGMFTCFLVGILKPSLIFKQKPYTATHICTMYTINGHNNILA